MGAERGPTGGIFVRCFVLIEIVGGVMDLSIAKVDIRARVGRGLLCALYHVLPRECKDMNAPNVERRLLLYIVVRHRVCFAAPNDDVRGRFVLGGVRLVFAVLLSCRYRVRVIRSRPSARCVDEIYLSTLLRLISHLKGSEGGATRNVRRHANDSVNDCLQDVVASSACQNIYLCIHLYLILRCQRNFPFVHRGEPRVTIDPQGNDRRFRLRKEVVVVVVTAADRRANRWERGPPVAMLLRMFVLL